MSNKKYFWLDTETSGRSPDVGNQILSIAIVMENHLGQTIKSLDLKIKVKPNAVIESGALAINGINPYCPEWEKEAISYKDAQKEILNFVISESSSDSELISLAYQASFDFNFINAMFAEYNQDFLSLFDQVVDPLKLAKSLTSSQKMKPEKKKNKDGTDYYSNSLQSVAGALGTKAPGASHSAMPDVITMMLTTKAMWRIGYGQELHEAKDLTNYSVILRERA